MIVAIVEPGSVPAGRLSSASVAWLTTVRADGQPQSSYVWFHFDGTDLQVASQPQAAKLRNIRANPKVSLHLDGDGQGGDVVTIEGVAEILEGDPSPERIEAYLAKYNDAIRTQLQTTPDELRREYSTTIRITPSRVRAW